MMNINGTCRDTKMNILTNRYFKTSLNVLVALGSLVIQPAYANDWWKTLEDKNGFSEFSPPVRFTNEHKHNKAKVEWRSGSSFKEFNKDKYVNSRVPRNPWKPVKVYGKKQSFNGQRPWGNVPERKRNTVNNMRFHDQRFKKWISQMDTSYRQNPMFAGSRFTDSRFAYGNNLPGGFVPFGVNNPVGYGAYQNLYYPNSGFSNRPWFGN